MPLPKAIAAALASAAARRRRDGRNTVTAVGKLWQAALVSSMRGPVLTRRAKTRADAFSQAPFAISLGE